MDRSIPEFLYNLLLKEYDKETLDKIIEGYSKRRRTTLRVNTIKSDINIIKEQLKSNNVNFETTEWNENALIIKNANEDKIRKLEIYKNGEIYLQSLSSMIPAIILSAKEGENILDMTAAPGGKTTQIASLSNNKAIITACEKNKIRAERLKYNLDKQGVKRVSVIVQDARKLDDLFSFDKILLDAPCSGSGTIDINNEKLDKTFTQELVYRSIEIQKQLLNKAIKILKKNGELIYSTCSILKEENENIIKEVISKNNIELVPIKNEYFKDIPLLPTSLEGTICVYPNETYEGFFIAKLRKI